MRDTLRFLLNGELQEIRELAPHTTVLRWLREHQSACGTKEGCAEGDCGACTVVVVELLDQQLRHRAINSCIALLAGLDGKALITVEGLGQDPQAPHPIQRELAQQHGSQCGFCTPGFVMSMFAHLQDDSPRSARDTLAGNLCRCTGYRPILDTLATLDPAQSRAHSGFLLRQIHRQLEALDRDEDLQLEHPEGRYIAPASAASLGQTLLEHPQAQLIAGGTDVGLWISKQGRRFATTVATHRVTDLRYVRERGGWLEIGAGATYSDAQAALGRWHPALGQLLRRIGSTQIRNSGTVLGNIANGSPIGDMPPALMALGATLDIALGDSHREIPLHRYFLDYGKQDLQAGEYLRALRIPPLAHNEHFACYKISKRFEQDISAVCAAFWVDIAPNGNVVEARMCFGGMAATPRHASHVENTLMGSPLSVDSAQRAAEQLKQDFQPLSDWRASAAYRLQVAKNLLLKFALESQGAELSLYPEEPSP